MAPGAQWASWRANVATPRLFALYLEALTGNSSISRKERIVDAEQSLDSVGSPRCAQVWSPFADLWAEFFRQDSCRQVRQRALG